MGGPGSGGARSGGNKSNATRAKEAARKDKSQGRLSSFFSGTNSEPPADAGGHDDHSKRRTSDISVIAHFEDEDLEVKRKEAIKILHKVMNEGGFETTEQEQEPVGDDDEDEDDIDDDASGCTSTASTRKSAAYMPQPVSPLAEYLRQVKDQFLFGSANAGGDSFRDQATTDGLHDWIPPPADPVVSSNPSSPHAWYLSDVWCFFCSTNCKSCTGWDFYKSVQQHLPNEV